MNPYTVEILRESDRDVACRLTGPDIDLCRPYAGDEHRQRLEDLAVLLNVAWRAGRRELETPQVAERTA